MKRKLVSFIAVISCFLGFSQCPNPVPDGKTCILDPAFEAYLETTYGGDGVADNNLVDTANISGVTTLTVALKGIADLTGIEDFMALQTLFCNSNSIVSLDLSSNTNLLNLYCNNNDLTSLMLPNSLQHIECFTNDLTDINLLGLTNLATLVCGNNPLNGLDLQNNLLLTTLYCQSSTLSTLDVANNTDLLILSCEDNSIMDINLSNNTMLIQINLNKNNLTELDVSNTTQLTTLSCNLNGLQQLNLKNGYNGVLNSVSATFNSLSCVQVDDENEAMMKGGWNFDGGVTFSMDCATASTDKFNLSSVSIHPNPSKDIFEVDLIMDADYRLFNIQGQKILNGSFEQGLNRLDVSTISNGVYVLNFENDFGSISKKLVKN